MSSKLASLHAGLVARKGEAMPALSRAALAFVDTPRPPVQPAPWDDGDVDWYRDLETPEPRRQPAAARPAERPAEVRPVERPAFVADDKPARPALQAVPVPAPAPAAPVRKEAGEDHLGPYRLTFRMTKDQRRRLRIAAARQDASLQKLLSDALDAHLDSLCACSRGECTCLAREDGA